MDTGWCLNPWSAALVAFTRGLTHSFPSCTSHPSSALSGPGLSFPVKQKLEVGWFPVTLPRFYEALVRLKMGLRGSQHLLMTGVWLASWREGPGPSEQQTHLWSLLCLCQT